MSKKKLRTLKWIFMILAYICLFLPTFIIILKNRNEFFKTNVEGMSVAMGGVLAIVYTAVLFKIGFKKIQPTISCGVLVLVCYCLQSVLNYAFVLSIGLTVGVAAYSILMLPEKYFAKLLDTYVDEEVREGVRNTKKTKTTTTEVTEPLESGRC